MQKVLVTESDYKAMKDECDVFIGKIVDLAFASYDHVIDPYYVNQLSAAMMSHLTAMKQFAMGYEDNLQAITAYNVVYALGNTFSEHLAIIRSNQRKLKPQLESIRLELVQAFN